MVVICNQPYPVETLFHPHFDTFPYPLSDFQKYAIQSIVEGNRRELAGSAFRAVNTSCSARSTAVLPKREAESVAVHARRAVGDRAVVVRGQGILSYTKPIWQTTDGARMNAW